MEDIPMKKITPFLWYDDSAEEAMALYASLLEDSELIHASRLQVDSPEDQSKATLVTARLAGREVEAMNGGPGHPHTPSASLFVGCETVEQVDRLWEGLSEGGTALMPLDAYPFSERFGWVQDRYGVSWQISLTGEPQSLTPFLMLTGEHVGKAEEAVDFYTSLFPNSGIDNVAKDDQGHVMMANFRLLGEPFILNESAFDHGFNFTDAFSLFVSCETQDQVDTLWQKLTADGGKPVQCGWLKDRYGVSWQVIPERLMELMGDPDQEKAGRVAQAMLGMVKIDIAGLEAAYAGGTAPAS
jgi:predicted 3-demethylubiquinone-9 3-methyltransferase (glyoxalase superfamily)